MPEENQNQEKPILYFSSGEECREAYLSMLASKIPCEFRPVAEDTPPPYLLDGYMRHEGLNEIKEFIEKHKKYLIKL